jgi:hypothetical protein
MDIIGNFGICNRAAAVAAGGCERAFSNDLASTGLRLKMGFFDSPDGKNFLPKMSEDFSRNLIQSLVHQFAAAGNRQDVAPLTGLIDML